MSDTPDGDALRASDQLDLRWLIAVATERARNLAAETPYPRGFQVFVEDVEELHPALQLLLARELEAGNALDSTWRGWPYATSVCVALRYPFMRATDPLPPDVTFRDLDDPHYWKAEYEHVPSGHLLACRFRSPA